MYLYVMSRPHSGSTILDILLGNCEAVESVGQLCSDMGRLHNPCACGATIRECDYWQEVRARVAADGISWDEAVRSCVGQAHIGQFWRTLRASPDDVDMQRLTRVNDALDRAINAVSGKPIVLDSTKEPTRALFLARYCPSARLIRLVRDPRSAVASHYWRLKDKGYFHFLRRDYRLPVLWPLFLALAAMSWTVGNWLNDFVASRAPGRVVRVRYEDLRDRPGEEISRIAKELGIDPGQVLSRLASDAPLQVGHIIGGNDVRHERGLRFDPKRETKRRVPPRWVEPMTVALCWPLMGRYGYTLRRQRRVGGVAPGQA